MLCRLWAIVTSSFPLRAYLFDGGVVVFGNTTPEDKKEMTSDDFIVNLWHLGRTTEARPWSVAEFKVYLDNLTGSRQSYDSLWREIQRSLGTKFWGPISVISSIHNWITIFFKLQPSLTWTIFTFGTTCPCNTSSNKFSQLALVQAIKFCCVSIKFPDLLLRLKPGSDWALFFGIPLKNQGKSFMLP